MLIIGTNAVGKSTLARNLINLAGGVRTVVNNVTYCNDGESAFIGDYMNTKNIVGVDSLKETKVLCEMISGIECKNIYFEGLKCGTFGTSIQTALFQAKKQLVVFLFASASTIHERLIRRSGKGLKTSSVMKQQRANLSAAKKYKDIGVPVLFFNTDNIKPDEISKEVYKKINSL